MSIQGLRSSESFATNERPKNFREGILRLDPNGMTPMYGLTAAMKTVKVDDAERHWFEKKMSTRRIQLTTAITTGTTAFAFSGGGCLEFKKNDRFLVEDTGELVEVTTDPSSETGLNFKRSVGTVSATALDPTAVGKNPFLMYIGNALPEGSLPPTAVGRNPTERYQYTQIFRDTLSATRTAMKTRLRTGDQVKEAKRECLEFHKVGIERSMWFEELSIAYEDGEPKRTQAGIISQIPTANVFAGGGASGLDMQTLEGYLIEIFRYGSSEKMVWGGNRSLMAIQQIVRKNSQFQIMSGIKEYGMKVTRIDTPFGSLVFKTHPMFNQIVNGTTGGTAYYGLESDMYILDMANLNFVVFDNDDAVYQPDLQANGMDGKQSGYLSEVAIEVHHQETHFAITNLVKGNADA